MKKVMFIFSFFLLGLSTIKTEGQGCSFNLQTVFNECGSALLGVMDCPDCSSYSWSNGAKTQFISVTASGTYRVTVTSASNVCTSVAQKMIEVAAPCTGTGGDKCSFDVAIDDKECGKTTLEVVNCPDCSSYSWSNGETSKKIAVTQSGTYRVTITSNSNACTSVASKTVSVSSAPTVSIAGEKFFCSGDKGFLVAVATGATEYCWSTGSKASAISVSTAGIYSVTVTSASGCTATASTDVFYLPGTQAPKISLEIKGSEVVATAYPASAQYKWSTGETSPKITVKKAGIITVQTKNHDGCWSESSCESAIVISGSTGDGCCGTSGDGMSLATCNKNGIMASNGMSYGAGVVCPANQLFLYAPFGLRNKKWQTPRGPANGGGWYEIDQIIAETGVGTHFYSLSGVNNRNQTVYYCFVYTILSHFDSNNLEDRVQKSEEYFLSPEEYKKKMNEFNKLNSNSNFSEMSSMNVFPNPTDGPVRIEMEMEIPSENKGLFFLTLTDPTGRVIKTEKVIKN